MPSTVKVYRRIHPDGTPKSPFWHAMFDVWDAERQRWKQKMQSTRCTNEAKALEVAREFERVALAIGGPDNTTRLSRDFLAGVLDDILRISGHRPVVHSKTWKDYSESWLAAAKKRIPKTLSERTWQNYSAHLKNFNGWLGKDVTMPLGVIAGDQIQAWYHAGIESGLSPNTMNNTTTTLSTIFSRAIDEGFTTRNPVNLINREDTGGNKRDPFSMEQMDTVLAHLRRTQQQDWLTVALLGFCTSQRLSDCANALRVHFAKMDGWWTWTVTQGKTGKSLCIPLVEPLAAHIEALMGQQSPSLFLAPSLANAPVSGWQDGLSFQFAAILSATGIAGRHVEGNGKGRAFNSLSFHSTRHTCNTLLAQAGVPFETRKLITGHGDLATNIIYTHLDLETKGNALTKAFKRKSA